MKKFLEIVLTITLVVVVQHSPKNKRLYFSNGKPVYQADCSSIGNKYDMGDCLKLAGKKCPQGFDIVMQREEVVGRNTEGGVKGSSRSESQSHRNGNDGYESSYSTSTSSFNASSKRGESLSFSRYIVYTCKPIDNK